MIEYEDWGSARIAQLEQQDLDRYHRDRAKMLELVRLRRPVQRSEMGVPDYYRHFCYWREDMMSAGCPDNDSSYIDDFIGNLQWNIRLRLHERRSSLSTLNDAYYEAHHHEVIIRLDEFIKGFRTANEIAEMASQSTIEIQGDDICDSVEEEYIVNNQQAAPYAENLKGKIAEPYAHKLFDAIPRPPSIEIREEHGVIVSAGACDEQHPDGSQFTEKLLQISVVKYEGTELNEENDGVFLGKVANLKVFDVMTEPYLEKNLLSIEALKATHYMPMLSPVDLDEDLYGSYVSLISCPYSIKSRSSDSASDWVAGILTNISKVIAQDLNYEDVVLGYSVTKFPQSLLESSPRVFDPGTLFKQEEYKSQLQCTGSGLFLNYSEVYGEFSAYNHLVTEFCCGLFKWSRCRDNKIDWPLSMWNNRQILLWNCRALLWRCIIITGDYMSVSTNVIANSYGALAQRCITYDMSVPRLNNEHTEHEISDGTANAHLTTADMLSQMDYCGDKHFLSMLNSDSNAVIFSILDIIAHRDSFYKSLFEGAELIILVALGQKTMNEDDSNIINEMPPTFQVNAKNEPLMAPNIRGTSVAGLQGMNSLLMFIFDPGIDSLNLTGCAPLNFSEMPGNSVVDLWIGNMLLCFDPGVNTFVLGTWSLRKTVYNIWDRLFDDTSALQAINRFPMKKTYTGRFDRFDVSQKMLEDYSNFALLIPIYLTRNGLHLCDLVMPLSLFIHIIHRPLISIRDHDTSQASSLFMQITIIMYYFYGVCENEFLCCWKLSSSYVVFLLIPMVLYRNAILLYILEDKDCFEGMEKKILAMVMIRSIKGKHCMSKTNGMAIQLACALKQDDVKLNATSAHYYAHTRFLACSLVDKLHPREHFLDALLPRKLKMVEDAYGGYPNAKQRCIVVQKDHIIVEDWHCSKFLVPFGNVGFDCENIIDATFGNVGFDCENIIDAMRSKRFDGDSELHVIVQNLINKDINPSPQFGQAFSTLGLEHYIWDPGSSAALMGGSRVDASGNVTQYWINSRDLYGIHMRRKAESLVTIGRSNSPICSLWLDIHEKYNIWSYGKGLYVPKWILQHCRFKHYLLDYNIQENTIYTLLDSFEIVNTMVASRSLEAAEDGLATNHGCDDQTNIHSQLVTKVNILFLVSHFTTLRTRWLLRGRTCHVPRVKSVQYDLLSFTDVICDVITLSIVFYILECHAYELYNRKL